MFDVDKTNIKEIVRASLVCQMREVKVQEELIKSEGLRLKQIPEVKKHDHEWISSRFTNPNSWRYNEYFLF